MSESELNEREQRLAEIRKLEQAATPGPWVIGIHERYGWPGFTIRDMQGPTHEEAMRDADFIAAARDDIPYLLAEIDRLTAERDALRADAALGALVRRMPEMLGHMYDDETDGECRTFLPDWVSLVLDKRPEEWLVQLGAEDSCLWWVADLGSPERVLEHALAVAATKEASDD